MIENINDDNFFIIKKRLIDIENITKDIELQGGIVTNTGDMFIIEGDCDICLNEDRDIFTNKMEFKNRGDVTIIAKSFPELCFNNFGKVTIYDVDTLENITIGTTVKKLRCSDKTKIFLPRCYQDAFKYMFDVDRITQQEVEEIDNIYKNLCDNYKI